MVIHDISDLFRAINHFFENTAWAVQHLTLAKSLKRLHGVVWTYLRIVMLGLLINEIHENIPGELHAYYEYRLNQVYVVVVLTGLFFLQCYWTSQLFINFNRIFELHSYFHNKQQKEQHPTHKES